MMQNRLIDLLKQPIDDPADNLVWAKPIASGLTLAQTNVPPRPMYPIRKLVARSRRCKTSELPTSMLAALSDIEQGEAGYQWAFATVYDAWQMGSKNLDLNHQPTTHPQALMMHKLQQLGECFPSLFSNDPFEIVIFGGKGIFEHPGLLRRGATAAEIDKGVFRLPRDQWDSAAYLNFMRGVWLVQENPEVEPVRLSLDQFKSIWDSVFSYAFTTFERDFEVQSFRNALADQLERG